MEADTVIDNNIHEVSIKFTELSDYIYQNQSFNNDLAASIISIEFTNYVEEVNNEITEPVIINFSSFKDRVQCKDQKVKIIQKTLRECKGSEKIQFDGQVMVSCYHIGSHETINETYQKICDWSRKHKYILGEESFERYVSDYWTTRNSALFVTEIMMNVSRELN